MGKEPIKSKIRILEKLENYGSAIEERKKKHIGLYNTAIEALEKQLPKKPNFEGDGYALNRTFVYDTWICPNCDMYTPAYVAKEEAIKAWNRRVK